VTKSYSADSSHNPNWFTWTFIVATSKLTKELEAALHFFKITFSSTHTTVYAWATLLIHVRDQGALGEYLDVRSEKKQKAGKGCAVVGSVMCNLVTKCMQHSPSVDVHGCEFLGTLSSGMWWRCIIWQVDPNVPKEGLAFIFKALKSLKMKATHSFGRREPHPATDSLTREDRDPQAKNSSPNQIHRVSRHPTVHYRPQLDSIQSQTNPVHTLPP